MPFGFMKKRRRGRGAVACDGGSDAPPGVALRATSFEEALAAASSRASDTAAREAAILMSRLRADGGRGGPPRRPPTRRSRAPREGFHPAGGATPLTRGGGGAVWVDDRAASPARRRPDGPRPGRRGDGAPALPRQGGARPHR